jgi:hypothetical protein
MRKGELSSSQVDREWPHQVALRADFVAGHRHQFIERVKSDLGGCPRGHSVRFKEEGFVVYCFSTPESANTFRELFSGEPFNPKDRGRGSRWWEWRRPMTPTPQTIESNKRQIKQHLDAAHSLAETSGLQTVAYLVHVALEEMKGEWAAHQSTSR